MPSRIDLTNTETDYFKILTPAESKGKRTMWNCICKRCGNRCIISTDSLRNKNTTTRSCGCLKKELLSKRNKENYADLTGQHFGNLVCIEKRKSSKGHMNWLCKCDCGNFIIASNTSLRAGHRLSCGCLRMSFGASQIRKILDDNNFLYKTEVTFPDLKNMNNKFLYFDFVVYNSDGSILKIIEYDGEQHFSSKGDLTYFVDTLEMRQEYDNIKNEYCKKNNYKLLRVPYWDKNKITLNYLFNEEEINNNETL